MTSELKEVWSMLGIHSVDEELMAMVCKVDCNQEGFIDIEELVNLN